MAPDVCVTKPIPALALLCLWLSPLAAGSPLPPRVLQSDTNVALLPRGSLPANFTVLSVALLPDAAAAANVTLLPLVPPQLLALPPGADSVYEQLPLYPPQPPDLPPSAAGNAYVLSHVIIEVGVLDDDNSTDSSTDDPDQVDFTAKDVEDGRKNEAITNIEAKVFQNEHDLKGDDQINNKKEERIQESGKNSEPNEGKGGAVVASTTAKAAQGGDKDTDSASGSSGKGTAAEEKTSGKLNAEESGEGNKATADSSKAKVDEGKGSTP